MPSRAAKLYWWCLALFGVVFLVSGFARNQNGDAGFGAGMTAAGRTLLGQNAAAMAGHKQLMPVSSRDIGVFIAAAVSLFIAAGAGIGAGPALVPIFLSLGQFSQAVSVALSNSTILAGALASVLITAGKRHPSKNKSLIDWDLIMLMEPPTLLGAIAGSYINKLMPFWVSHILLALLLTFMTCRVLQRAQVIYKQETQAHINAAKLNKEAAHAATAAIAAAPGTNHNSAVVRAVTDNRVHAGGSFGGADAVVELAEAAEPGAAGGCSGQCGSSSSQADAACSCQQGSRAQAAVRQPITLPHSWENVEDLGVTIPPQAETHSRSQQPAAGAATTTAAAPPAASSPAGSPSAYQLSILAHESASTGASPAQAAQEGQQEAALPPHHMTNLHEPSGLHHREHHGSASGKQLPQVASAAAAVAVERVLRAEAAQAPLLPLGLLTIVFLAVLLTSLFSKNAGCGTTAYWLVQWSVAPVLLGVWWISRRLILAKMELKKDALVDFTGEVRWTPKNSIIFPLICTGAGVIAGMFGLGGAVVKTPLMLELGVHPQVTAATTQAMMLLTAGASTIVYAQLGDIPWDYAAVILPLSFCVTLAGQLTIDWLVKKLGRSSVVVLVLVFFFVVASMLTYAVTGVSIAQLVRNPAASMALGAICEPPILDLTD